MEQEIHVVRCVKYRDSECEVEVKCTFKPPPFIHSNFLLTACWDSELKGHDLF